MKASASGAISAGGEFQIAARIERLPISSWHRLTLSILGAAWFFDAFDALAIGYVLPVLAPLWHLGPSDIGTMIAIGYVGQAIGSVAFGWLAERFGRIPNAIATLLIFSLSSLCCAFAWSFPVLLTLRFIQGIGLGGEIPIMAAYMSEIVAASRRGRFMLTVTLPFAIGLVAAAFAGRWIVPHLGWQWMFVLGAVPALLALPLWRLLPESPRWLASRGRRAEADRVMQAIEDKVSRHGRTPLAPVPATAPAALQGEARFGDLFQGRYLRRTFTVCALYFCAYFVSNGLQGWLPTIYRTVYKLPLEQSLQYGLISQASALFGIILITIFVDRVGRKRWFSIAFLLGAVPLFVLGSAASLDPFHVALLVGVVFSCINSISFALSMFTAENFPTHMRALGGGIAAACLRVASFVAPYVVGLVLSKGGIDTLFILFGVVAVSGGVVCLVFAIETRGRVLEEVSPGG